MARREIEEENLSIMFFSIYLVNKFCMYYSIRDNSNVI